MQRLPSLNAFKAFEAAARHLSFTRAAIELGITQGAVSQRLAKLESVLGGKLFAREGNLLQLTPLGQDFLPSARDTIVRLASATDHAVERQRGNTLAIGCLATYAIKVLIPHLHQFRAAHPHISIRLRSFAPGESPLSGVDRLQVGSVLAHDYDVHIQFGSGTWPGMISHKLGDEYVFPAVSAKALRRSGRLRHPADLAQHSVILNAYPITGYDYWPVWLEEAGVGGLAFAEEVYCDPLYTAIQAAVDGLGVIMGRSSLIGAELQSGQLIAPFRQRLHSPLSYYLVVPRERAESPKIEQFCAWALKTLRVSPG
jgi:LysR family glycine cleavage system transcriptional activator